MKKFIALAIFAGVNFVNAQELDKYKYFNINKNTSDFKDNQYQLTSRLNFYLEKKNYKILDDDRNNWPNELVKNQCNLVNVDLIKQKSMLKNKLDIQFRDCNNKIIETFEGSSNIKDFDKGYQDALQKALSKIKVHKYTGKEVDETNINKEIPTTFNEGKKEPHPVIKEEVVSNFNPGRIDPHPVIKEEIKYDNNVKKVDLKDGGFLLMNASNMQTLAQFEPTLRPYIYRVTVFKSNGEKYPSIGYTEGNTISFEYLEDGKWNSKYIKLY